MYHILVVQDVVNASQLWCEAFPFFLALRPMHKQSIAPFLRSLFPSLASPGFPLTNEGTTGTHVSALTARERF